MSKVTLKVEIEEETYKQIKDDSVCSNNNECIISKSSSAYYALNAIINATPIIECDDAVSRQAVLDEVRAIATWHSGDAFNEDRVITHMKMLSSVTPKREQGEWIEVHPLQEDDGGAYMCSKCRCGHPCIDPDYWKYCPYCGAEMR